MLLYWIWFAQLKKLSAAQKQTLLRHFSDPEDIYHSDSGAFSALDGMTEAMLEALENKDLSQAQQILAECTDKGIGIVTCNDENYPARLRNTYDAPVLLYFKGNLPQWEHQPVIGIVGTRKATPYGMNTAVRFGRQIAACGALVVSGGAFGIDTMAMQGALDAGCPVVGVLGCGVDVVYPKSNRQLFSQVREAGCLISEYPPGTQGLPWHFPERNRIISGISNGLLVVEAPEKSGALITARCALEQGRDVFAVPGNVDVESCIGSNGLLQEGAVAALSGWDVVKEYEILWPGVVRKQETDFSPREKMNLKVAQAPAFSGKRENLKVQTDKKGIDKEEKSTYSVLNNEPPALSEAEQAVLALISREPKPIDDIIAQADLSAGTVKSVLTKLALKRLTVNHPGGRVSLQ